MLNKEVCRKCFTSRKIHLPHLDSEAYFDLNWDHYHYVYCTPNVTCGIKNEAPDYCLYILEHMVSYAE